MGRNGSRHGAQTKRGRKTLSAAASPNFAAFLFSPRFASRNGAKFFPLSAISHARKCPT